MNSNLYSESAFSALLRQHYTLNQSNRVWIRSGAAPFAYSDGDVVEQQLLELLQNASDLRMASDELRCKAMGSWPLTYHLHPRRANLLRPIQHLLQGKVLEVGAGCGAISRFLGEQGCDVLAVEGSERRAAIAAARCRELPNVAVLADQFHQLPITAEYDVVTLIGVLEYARLYFPCKSGDAVDALLARARQFLKPGGVLIVAIENQLGLKYFAGYAEDHTNQLMQGIEDRYMADGVVTFGRYELARRLSAYGFSKQQWWFPFPDYKLPTLLLSDYLLSNHCDIDISPLLSSALSADVQAPAARHFSLELAGQTIARNRLFGELANSFLIVASGEKIVQQANIIGYHYAVDRREEFNKVVSFIKINQQIIVDSQRLYPEAVPSEVVPLTFMLPQQTVFVAGQHWQHRLCQIVNQPGWQMSALVVWANKWLQAFLLQADLTEPPSIGTLVSGNLVDALPRNLIIESDGRTIFIDQEWHLHQPIEFGYLIFRALFISFLCIGSIATPYNSIPKELDKIFFELARQLGIVVTPIDFKRYLLCENDFIYWACQKKDCYSFEQMEGQVLIVRETVEGQKKLLAECEKKLMLIESSRSWRWTYLVRRLVDLYKYRFIGS